MNTIPFGRLGALQARPDANLLAYRPGRGAFDDCVWKRYSSRLALETFLRQPGAWRAVEKNLLHPTMLLNPAFEKATQ